MAKYLGVDFGLRRVGLALSEGELASAWQVVEGKGLKDLVNKVTMAAKQEEVDLAVVGMPEGKMGQTVKGFIRLLREGGLSVVEADETLSSQKALELMIETGISRGKRKVNDATAAAIILQGYLDEH